MLLVGVAVIFVAVVPFLVLFRPARIGVFLAALRLAPARLFLAFSCTRLRSGRNASQSIRAFKPTKGSPISVSCVARSIQVGRAVSLAEYLCPLVSHFVAILGYPKIAGILKGLLGIPLSCRRSDLAYAQQVLADQQYRAQLIPVNARLNFFHSPLQLGAGEIPIPVINGFKFAAVDSD